MRIVHVFRSPLGGLFRHVADLAAEQTRMGHAVGIVCASEGASPASEAKLAELEAELPFGVTRIAMSRQPHPSDIIATRNFRSIVSELKPDIVHGHGAKGGLYARLSGAMNVYTPHGGSLHYRSTSPAGFAFISAEKYLAKKTTGFVFVCEFECNEFSKKIGASGKRSRVVHNGLRPGEFAPVPLGDNPTDLLFVGEMRKLKGVDTLLDALATLPDVSATLVGTGSERGDFEKQANRLGVATRVKFVGHLPMHEGLKRGNTVVLPSRHESFPYVVLEAAAAGRTVIATAVGGIPEVLSAEFMCTPGDPAALANLIRSTANRTQPSVKINSVAKMAREIIEFYASLLGGETR